MYGFPIAHSVKVCYYQQLQSQLFFLEAPLKDVLASNMEADTLDTANTWADYIKCRKCSLVGWGGLPPPAKARELELASQ